MCVFPNSEPHATDLIISIMNFYYDSPWVITYTNP